MFWFVFKWLFPLNQLALGNGLFLMGKLARDIFEFFKKTTCSKWSAVFAISHSTWCILWKPMSLTVCVLESIAVTLSNVSRGPTGSTLSTHKWMRWYLVLFVSWLNVAWWLYLMQALEDKKTDATLAFTQQAGQFCKWFLLCIS